jgi:hypothetical protein
MLFTPLSEYPQYACFFAYSRYNEGMRHRILSILLLSSIMAYGQEVTENMKTLFYSYETDAQRLELINTHLSEGGSLGDFAQEAFLFVTRDGEPGNDNLRSQRIELQKTLLRNINGSMGLELTEATLNLQANSDDPLLRGEIYQAWGRTKAEGPWETLLSRVLALVNSTEKTKAEEIEAYAAVQAIEDYQTMRVSLT